MLAQVTHEDAPTSEASEKVEERTPEDEDKQNMKDDELTVYHNRYIALVDDQKQKLNIVTEE